MLTDDLKKIIKGEVSSEKKTLDEYSTDASIFRVEPQAVVCPKDSEDIKNLVKFASERKKSGENISLTARSAGTDMGGGPLNDSVIVSFTQHFNHIKEIKKLSSESPENAGYVVVEPGVYYRDLEKELDEQGLLYPPYPASKSLCAMGGIVSNNSGGEKTLAYGKTEDYIETVRVVLADGEEHLLGPLTGGSLQEKLKENSFEGEIYRKIYDLVDKNYDEIKKAKPDVSKNSSGYALWNVWDKKTFNMAKLFVGAQGTFGLMTEAKLRLVEKKKFSRMMVVFAKSLDPVPDLVEALLALKPESIESYDDKTLSLALKFLPALLKLMKGNLIKMAFKFLPEFFMVLRGGFPKMVLLVEFTDDDDKKLAEKMKQALVAAKKFPVQARLAKNKDDEEKYWTIRRQSFSLLHSHVKNKYAAPFIDDIIVKPEFMPEFLPKVNAILAKYKNKLVYTIAGHPGNGNFHIIPLVDLTNPEIPKIIEEVSGKIYKLVAEYKGSITAEHNDGLIRAPYLKDMFSAKILELFAEVKKIMDPLDIFNPHKKTDGSMDYTFGHLRKDNSFNVSGEFK